LLKRIHVNQYVIRGNRRDNADDLRIKTSKANIPAHEIEISGPARVIYSPDKPLACGARVWIETDAPLLVRRAGDKDVPLP
jgi:hypothetical protein